MGTDGFGYERSKPLEIAEQIYSCQEEKERLELELDAEKFHQNYIPRRKKFTRGRFFFYLLLVFFLTILVLGSFLLLAMAVADSEFASANAVLILGAALSFVFGGYADVKLIISEIHMFKLLRVSVSDERAMLYASKHDINTFQNDQIRTRKKIELLEGEIAALDKRLLKLTEEQRQLTKEQQISEKMEGQTDLSPEKPENSLD